MIGTLAAQVVRAHGAYVTLLDPSGLLTRLTELPELRGHARGLSLLDAPPGTLNPYSMIADPQRGSIRLGRVVMSSSSRIVIVRRRSG